MWTRFFVRTLIFVPPFYLLACAAIATAVAYGNPYRMPNVRDFPHEIWPQISGVYLNQQIRSNTVLLVGSSFTYGYSFAADLALTPSLSKATGRPVVNVGIIAGSLEASVDHVFCAMANRNLHVKTIIVEIPLVNEMHTFSTGSRKADFSPCRRLRPWSATETIARHPSASAWLLNVIDQYRLARIDYDDIIIAPVDEDYFTSEEIFQANKDILKHRIRNTLLAAAMFADEVYAFVSPVYLDGIETAGRERQPVANQFAFAEGACVEVLGSRCIRTESLTTRREIYSNLTHLSIRGHGVFAEHVAKALRE